LGNMRASYTLRGAPSKSKTSTETNPSKPDA
jgi:hypothetical protein